MKVNHFQDSNSHHIILPSMGEITLSDINSRWFEASYWQNKDRIAGQSQGREITWFIKSPQNAADMEWALRHYYRGGLAAKLSNDSYFFNGLTKTRCYREVDLLQQMCQLDLPVPKPIAARVIQKGFFYKADLLMEKINGEDLVLKLKKAPLTERHWQSVGKMIADFHNKGIYHADLNAHNILIDSDNKLWLIDFDRCKKRVIQSKWQNKNIDRLHRSLLKERSLDNKLHFEDKNWLALTECYSSCIIQ